MNEILNINNVHGYLDKKDGTAYLNAGDVARGFGFTKTETKNGVKYESVRWARVNEYLSSFGFRPNVGEDDYFPENMVYRLGFKASNEAAQKFQAVLADEVLPAIRRHGAYMTDQALQRAITEPDFLICLATQLKEEQAKRNRYRWGRISLVVIIPLAIALGIASGVKALMAEPEYVDKVVVVDEDETLWDICSRINDDREDVRIMIDRTMDRNHITDAGAIQPGQKLLVPVLKEK